jgi:hypothetical protein
MTTIAAGRLGGQYSVSAIGEPDTYIVQGLLHGKLHTIFKGDYEFATKLMDYCTKHDDEAQNAIHALYFDANPTPVTELFDHAREDREAKPRKRVEVWVRVATDVLESENAIELVGSRISQVAGMAGLVITQLEVHYAYPNEEFIPPPCDAAGLVRDEQLLNDSFAGRPTDRDEPTGSSFVSEAP